jgi:competence protein ComEC
MRGPIFVFKFITCISGNHWLRQWSMLACKSTGVLSCFALSIQLRALFEPAYAVTSGRPWPSVHAASSRIKTSHHLWWWYLTVAGLLIFASCGTQEPRQNGDFTFVVVNVGEGLSQIATAGSEAIVFDMGDTDASVSWTTAYDGLGKPHIGTIAISHSHVDHMGGLRRLPDSLDFSGTIVAGAYEDTSLIRATCGSWAGRVRFRLIGMGDTVSGLDGAVAVCLWPPKGLVLPTPIPDSLKNIFSLCFVVRYKSSSVLITSDIDTTAERALSARFGFGLLADAIVVPHHGSVGSVDPVFYGYVAPSTAILSCGAQNLYGHPAANVLAMLFQMHARLYQTAAIGTVTAFTEGYYWSVSGEGSPNRNGIQ